MSEVMSKIIQRGIPKVKICGIQSLQEALWAIEAGADALGFIFVPSSKRYISPQKAQKIIKQLPPFVSKVGVFVNETPEQISTILQQCFLDSIQLHGQENPSHYAHLPVCKIKMLPYPGATIMPSPSTHSFLSHSFPTRISLGDSSQPNPFHAIILDSTSPKGTGGTGIPLPWQNPDFQTFYKSLKSLGYPVILAGGLTPANVQEAIRLTRPYGVDVSSGVEEMGRKDRRKIQEFIAQVRSSESPLSHLTEAENEQRKAEVQ